MSAECVAVVAHDAGGAEILSSVVRRERAANLRQHVFALKGPARQIFAAKLGVPENLPLDEALAMSSSMLCGTGWQSTLETDAIALARAQGKRSVAFLDHWVNYRERFIRRGEWILPDEIWVGDAIARDLASQAFPGLPVTNVGNAYFDDIRQWFTKQRPPGALQGLSVLFVGEAIREHALREHGAPLHWGYTQQQALAYLLDHLDTLGAPVAQVIVRPHPAEDPTNYDEVIKKHAHTVQLSQGHDLFDDIAASDWVVGCNTMAMVVGLIAGRQVLCCIPPGGRPCMLPQPQIIHLQVLAAAGAP